MHENPVSATEDFKKLQQKVKEYKEILATLKNEHSKGEQQYFTEQVAKLEKQIETTHQEQNLKIQKQEEEMTILSTQVTSLHETVLELTEKLAAALETVHQNQGPSRKTKERPNSSIAKMPSFKQLQNLSIESQSIEKNEPVNNKQIRPKNRPSRPNQKGRSDFNKPSAEKKFSVKLASMSDFSLPHSVTNHDATHLKTNDTLNKEASQDTEKTSNQEARSPKDDQLDNEQAIDSPAQMVEPSSQNNISSSFLNFFRKK